MQRATEVEESERIHPIVHTEVGSSPRGSEEHKIPEDEASVRNLLLEIGRDRALSDNDERDTEETSSTVPPTTMRNRPHIPSVATPMLLNLQDPQQPEHLLLFQGFLDNKRCKILIDGGATNNFVSTKLHTICPSELMGIQLRSHY